MNKYIFFTLIEELDLTNCAEILTMTCRNIKRIHTVKGMIVPGVYERLNVMAYFTQTLWSNEATIYSTLSDSICSRG
jgi:hypothetical protein